MLPQLKVCSLTTADSLSRLLPGFFTETSRRVVLLDAFVFANVAKEGKSNRLRQRFTWAIPRVLIVPLWCALRYCVGVACVLTPPSPTHTHTHSPSPSKPWESSLARVANEVIIRFHLFKTTQLVPRS